MMAAMSSRPSTKTDPNPPPFIRDPDWAEARLSYSVQTLAPPPVQHALEQLRDQVEMLAPGCFLRVPAGRLHVSVQILASPRHDFDKAAYWAQAEGNVRHVLADFIRTQPQPFQWHFDRLMAAKLGVIVAAPPDPRLHDLRLRLLEAAPAPVGAQPPYPLVHCTLLRYAAPEKLPEDFTARVAALPCAVDWHAKRLDLLQGQRYPSLQAATLATFPLEGA
jgi:hypothetical protein